MKPTIILLLCIFISCKEKPLFKQVITIDGFADTIRINEHGQVDITNHWRDPAVTVLADTAFNEKFHSYDTTISFYQITHDTCVFSHTIKFYKPYVVPSHSESYHRKHGKWVLDKNKNQ